MTHIKGPAHMKPTALLREIRATKAKVLRVWPDAYPLVHPGLNPVRIHRDAHGTAVFGMGQSELEAWQNALDYQGRMQKERT